MMGRMDIGRNPFLPITPTLAFLKIYQEDGRHNNNKDNIPYFY